MSSLTKSIKNEALSLVFWQFIVILVLALVLFIFSSAQKSLSSLMGGLAYCLPNFLFVSRVFSRASIRYVKQFAFAFFLGEALKLFLGAALFVVVVRYLPVNMMYTLIGYIIAIMAFWVVSFISLSRPVGGAK